MAEPNKIDKLKALLGTWEGEGAAFFPTIMRRDYREQLTFALDKPHGVIQYEQKTWLIDNGNQSHWEFGFIRVCDDQSLELNNTQNNGRTEVMIGEYAALDSGFTITFMTKEFGNDPRMIKAAREWRIEGDALTYFQSMATNTVSEMGPHLRASLHRNQPSK